MKWTSRPGSMKPEIRTDCQCRACRPRHGSKWVKRKAHKKIRRHAKAEIRSLTY